MSELVADDPDPPHPSTRTQPGQPGEGPPLSGSSRLSTSCRVLCLVLLMGCCARVAVHHLTPTWVSADSVRFYQVAVAFHEDWRAGVEAMSDWTAPLPPVVWSPLLERGASYRPAIVLNHLLGLVSAGLVGWVLLRVSTPAVAALGGLALALSPQVLFMERWLLGETIHLATVSLACASAVVAASRPRMSTLAALGGALALAWLTKASSLALATLPIATSIILLSQPTGRADVRRIGAGLALMIVAFVVVVLPWQVHVWRAFQSINVVPNSQRNLLLYAGELGLFDTAGGHEGNASLMREAGVVLIPGKPISTQGWAIVNHLTSARGRGAPSEQAARTIVVEEVRRKPSRYARCVLRTLRFLLGASRNGVPEPHDQLTLCWSGSPPQTSMSAEDGYRPEQGSALAQGLLLRGHAVEYLVLRAAFLIGLVGALAACFRGEGRWRWALLAGLPIMAVLAGYSLALANNWRLVYPFLPLAILGAASPFTRPGGGAPFLAGCMIEE